MNTLFLPQAKRMIAACLVSLACFQAHGQSSAARSGRFIHGTGTNATLQSFVITLDNELGISNAPTGPVSTIEQAVLGITNLYQVDGTNTLEQTNKAHRIIITNAVAAFGSRYGGSPLYVGQNYRFGAYAGDSDLKSTNGFQALLISWNYRTNGAFVSYAVYTVPTYDVASGWTNLIQQGATTNISVTGLTITWAPVQEVAWGTDLPGSVVLTEQADSSATNYEYTIWLRGDTIDGPMVLDNSNVGEWSPMLTLDFDVAPTNQPTIVMQPQFQGQPLPAAYVGKSLAELLAAQTVVSNAVASAATNYTDLDNSPELRDHPTLDQFVTDMGSNALALTSYVFNNIQLCDAVSYNSDTNALLDTSINLGGVSRSAYATYMEGEGSPTEQCALLVYLLRRAGVPACYIYGPTDGIQMLDARLSMMLQMQIHGAINQNTGSAYTTNTLISVNYPWVAAYINGAWVHLFPWIKNTAVTEGFNLYDYMPAGYTSGYLWVRHYLTGDTNIFSLSSDTDVPSVLYPAFIKNALLTTAPGMSIDDMGTSIVHRQVEYNQWSDFPTPFAVTNGAVNTVHDLTSITNISGFAAWTNIWDTISVHVFASGATNKSILTGDMRICDLQDRKFLIRQQTNGSSAFTLTLSLAPYRPNATNVMNFTNDATLLNQQTLTLGLATSNDVVNVVMSRKRHRLEPSAVTNDSYWSSYLGVSDALAPSTTSQVRLGDIAAICLHSGAVSKQMLLPWAQEYWSMQQSVAANPSITNSLSPDVTQGTLPYLMGMSYWERVDRFRPLIEQLNKVQLGSVMGQGLSIVAAQRATNGTLIKPLNYYHPHVDMIEEALSFFGNMSPRPDEGADPIQTADNFNRLYIAEGSAQEHKVIEDFYAHAGGISTVRLLLQSQQPGQPGMEELNIDNYKSFSGSNLDLAIWQNVTNAFRSPFSNYVDVFITKKEITNSTVGYQGMGAMVCGYVLYQALISGNQLPANGGWGDPLPAPIYNISDYNNVSLSFNTSDNDNWSATYAVPNVSAPVQLAETVSAWNAPGTFVNLSSGALAYGGVDNAQQQSFDFASYNLGYTGAGAAADAYADAVNNGADYDPHVGMEYAQLASPVSDPVNAVTGEFYIDSTDLTLPGPMPLFIRRNYSSQDIDLGDSPFGYGWRPAYTPYLRFVTNNVIYAAELDGTVVAYRQPVAGTNFWQPMPADNPQLNNCSSRGIGSTANLFNNYITTNVSGSSSTNFYLHGADGSVRLFQYASFPLPGTNTFNRYRPYLQTWTDANGNNYSFSYQTDTNQLDCGQLLRVQSSNGNFLGFYYDAFSHIIQAYTEDGRRLYYDYDSHGDLVTVTLPDSSQINYTYGHTNSLTNIVSGGVTNTFTNIYSSHLLVQEQKPDGRTVANTYDGLRRVVTQAATVGSDLNLVTNAIFTYNNSFTNLTNTVITGTTAILDVFGHTNTYAYVNNEITAITNQLGQTITQVWFTNSSDTGYYPNSLKSRTDKRNLNTAFQYDAFGNLAQTVQTGNLTGGTAINETATNTFTYTTQNLLSTETDPVGNEMVFYYTNTAYPMSPTAVVKLANGTPVFTNQLFYTNVIQIVTNGGVQATNSAYGLVDRVIRGSAGTNDFLCDGRGFITQATRYTGTGDPAVVTTLLFDNRGQMVQKTDALGRSRTYAYDDMGRVTGEEAYESGATVPEGFNYSYYSENGDLVWTDGSRYNPEDYVWRDYDGAGRKITEMHWRSEANTNGGGVQAPVASSNLYATTFFQYDTYNNQIKVTDPLGNFVTNQFDPIGELTSSVAYSAAGVAFATNQYGYEPGGKTNRMVNPLGGTVTQGYTYAGKLMSQTNADGSTNAWTYYLDGRLHKEFLSNGSYWETTYNDAALTVSRVFHNASATALATNTVVMDARGNIIKRIDPNGFVFTNVYDGLDRIRLATGPAIVTIANVGINFPLTNFVTNILQQMTTYYYDSSGQSLTTSNALGEKTITTSDALGRTTQVGIYNSNNTNAVRVTSTSYSADHQSVSVTNGTGSNSIVTTTYTDNDGHPLLKIGYPSTNVTEFTWWQYDLAGNCLAQQQCSSNASGITVWATNGWTYDGLNRVQSETSKDGATTTYSLDALGDVTNRAMPGGLSWTATYLSDGRIATEQESGGSLIARSMTYSYYPSNNLFAGLLETVLDGRSTTRSNAYDDFLRLSSVVTTGSAGAQQTTTMYKYDARSSLTNLSQYFASNSTGPSNNITRTLDAYGHATAEIVSVAGATLSSIGQGFDAAGRRSQLGGTPYNYQADGMMIAADGSTFAYANNGLLMGRTNATRKYVVGQRDGRGRVLTTSTTAGLSTLLAETLEWRGDGRLTNYLAVRGDFTDQRYFGYSPYAQRLTQEVLNVGSMQSVTNNYTIDNGSTGGLGILTSQAQSGTLSDTWSVPGGGLDGVSRVTESQNTLITRPANGVAKGAGSVSATLNGNPVAVAFDGPDGEGTWRASLTLFPGSNTLSATAFDLSGQHSVTTNSSFTVNGGATDTVTNIYDGNGNITQRVWVSSLGVTNKIQTLTWDAFNRLINLTDRDANNSGFNFVSIYDGQGRRVRTIQTMVTNGVAISSPADSVSTVDSWYDPQVEFLEIGVNVNGTFTSKVYGPDTSGSFGGMQGVGGLETLYITGHTTAYGMVQDYFGNVLASMSNSVVTWTGARFSSYGPAPGYQPALLSPNTTLAQCLGWHGLRIDPDGDYHIGARRYDPVEGRFLNADPFGHAGSQDLYSFCHSDPVNFFDPTGRFGKPMDGEPGYDDQGSAIDRDYVGEAHFQEIYNQIGGFIVNLASFGIADPILGLSTGYGFNGTHEEKSQAAENLYLSVLLALPMLVPGAGEAGLAVRGGADALIGAGDAGLVSEVESSLATTEVANKITFANVTDEADSYVGQRFGQIVAENPVASASYSRLQSYGVDVTLDFGTPPARIAGQANPTLNTTTIFMQNNTTASEAVSTLVHESSHFDTLMYQPELYNTQYDEYLAARREFLFNNPTRPSLAQRQEIWNTVQQTYPNLPVGRNPFGN